MEARDLSTSKITFNLQIFIWLSKLHTQRVVDTRQLQSLREYYITDNHVILKKKILRCHGFNILKSVTIICVVR